MILGELKVGTIFMVPAMPQWGILMVSYLRDTRQRIYVSLSGNRWAHLPEQLEDTLPVKPLEFISTTLQVMANGVVR